MKSVFVPVFLCFYSLLAGAGEKPAWFSPLRDAVFAQTLRAEAVAPIYRETVKMAEAGLSGRELDAMLSRCELMMGKSFQLDERNDDALACYEKGIALAERSIAAGPNAEAYEMLSANIGQACMLKSKAWVMANGLKVEQNAKRALALDPRNAACQYMVASRWVFGPGVFGNPQRGITEMEAILNGTADLGKDDLFNVYSALGYAYIRLKQNREALPWIRKSLDLYPTNKFARDLLGQAG
ncbi:MAG: tetratricopeptide repeat protein [Treponema sp.]|jgi:tetratricopeptide (TPR) repeat protein|nr:tetratricopeptide repeat protein [Treponema sp.]